MCAPFPYQAPRLHAASSGEGRGCSGKCSGNCKNETRVWVLAACEGMISLFRRGREGQLTLIAQEGKTVAPSLRNFAAWLEDAAQEKQFDQLVLVGAMNDVAWLQHSLPESAAKRVVAEIPQPLEAAWFREAMPMPSLAGQIAELLNR